MPVAIPPPFTCPVPIIGPRNLALVLPGGVQLQAIMTSLYAKEDEVVRGLLGQLGLVLGVLRPFFMVLDAVLAIVRILGAVPKIPTKPADFLKEMKAAAKTFANLATLIPQLSLPILAGNAIDILELFLQGIMHELDVAIAQEARIREMEALMLDKLDPLGPIIDCAQQINRQRLCAVKESFQPLESLMEAVNLFMKLIGQPPIASLETLANDAFGARQQMLKAIAMLEDARRNIPTPRLIFKSVC